jgi:hypothetical protein
MSDDTPPRRRPGLGQRPAQGPSYTPLRSSPASGRWLALVGLVEDTRENHLQADAAFWSSGVREG